MINGVLFVCVFLVASVIWSSCNIFVWTNREIVTFTNDFLKWNVLSGDRLVLLNNQMTAQMTVEHTFISWLFFTSSVQNFVVF